MLQAPHPSTGGVDPSMSLTSIVRRSPLPPPQKLAAAARLLRGQGIQGLARELGVRYESLSRAINSPDNNGRALRERAERLLGFGAGVIFSSLGVNTRPQVCQEARQGVTKNAGREMTR